uniref:DNA-binding transcriptional activator DevR/DosR n=1 Tax=Ganoderma boninense TaxID=34458 RepID=A0A5K1K253_9APHY|nr:DNA-binding transcriptional activator DevR/DosR [Ganoderma boninense]
MSAPSSSDCLISACTLLCKLDKRQDSQQKTIISGLLTLAITAARLAGYLAEDEVQDTTEVFRYVEEELARGSAPLQAAFSEVLGPRNNTPPAANANGSTHSTPSAGPTEAPFAPHDSAPVETLTESDNLSPEGMIELISGHVHDRLLDTLIVPLTTALQQPLLQMLHKPLLDSLSSCLCDSLGQDPVLLEALSGALHGPLSTQILAELPDQHGPCFASSVVNLQVSSARSLVPPLAQSSSRTSHTLDPIATSLSGFKRRSTTPGNLQKKRAAPAKNR